LECEHIRDLNESLFFVVIFLCLNLFCPKEFFVEELVGAPFDDPKSAAKAEIIFLYQDIFQPFSKNLKN